MAYESRAYDDKNGEPVVVLVVSGQHDVSRLVNLFKSGMCLVEHISVGEKILKQVRRHEGGRAALDLLLRHGGPDFREVLEAPAVAYDAEDKNAPKAVR